jgi:uncharacterized protein
MKPSLSLLKGLYGIYKIGPDAEIEAHSARDGFFSLSKDNDEVTVVCIQTDAVQSGVIQSELNWKILKIEGPLDFDLTGIISGITTVLAEKKIPVFTLSTYSTDYILVREANLEKAVTALIKKGYPVLR